MLIFTTMKKSYSLLRSHCVTEVNFASFHQLHSLSIYYCADYTVLDSHILCFHNSEISLCKTLLFIIVEIYFIELLILGFHHIIISKLLIAPQFWSSLHIIRRSKRLFPLNLKIEHTPTVLLFILPKYHHV